MLIYGGPSKYKPWGIFDGRQGSTGSFSTVSDKGAETRLSNKPSTLRVGPDHVIRVITAGAGGFGNPDERTKEKLQEDIESGKFSKEFLTREYTQFDG